MDDPKPEGLFEDEDFPETEADDEAPAAPELILETGHTGDARDGLMRWDEALTLEGQVEAILFAAPKPFSVQDVAEILQDENGDPGDGTEIERVIQNLMRLYRERNGGFRLEHEKGVGYQFRTVPAAAPLMERMFSARQRPLSRAALETLSIIAYRQPVTRADIEAIRGVDAGSIIKNLLDRELISCVGRKEDSGRPMMFGTSPEFLRVFRINSLDDMPPLSAFQPAPETMAEAESRLDLGEEVDVDEFMDDPEAEMPTVSEGLVETAGTGDFADIRPDFQVIEQLELQDDEPAASTEPPRVGARFDAKGFDDDERGQVDPDTEVAFPTGPGLTPGGGEDADGGEDLDQRQDRERTRDED
ncbi:MAG TPA: SMC-Scp complex subunit ScpB [Oligoflexus sp.]|uniref:SMC-Scp complex subunit ScpB n=1 Tax=Oligoflexus sp. TaxID=1971216 RepID=UPI002D39EF7E|nr:SMC-Scp complex subunit ScpB [Oligoflexus sp.]HYX36810.1 SMC-Scp complex subunit ScpB [Oligoflexus sp.]